MKKQVVADIRELIMHEQDAMVDFLQDLAALESPSTVPKSQQKVLTLLEETLIDLDHLAIRVRGTHSGGALFARPKRRDRLKPLQLLIGHCDTVYPLNTINSMPVMTDQETVKGPGVYDMKGGLTQMIFSLRTLKLLNLDPPVTPVILINSDEEIGSKESTPYIRRLAKLADRAFILEPSLGLDGNLKTERKGVGRFTIKVMGKSAHAGLDPTAGASAIVELSYIIQKLFNMNDPKKQITVNVGMVEGGVRPNVVAAESSAVIDVRVPTQKDADMITKQILNLKPVDPKVTVSIEGGIGRPPMEATPKNRLLWEKAKNAGELMGIELSGGMAGGGSDGNTTSLYTATLDGLGATGDGAHAVHEFVYIDKLIERTVLLSLLLMMDPLENHTSAS